MSAVLREDQGQVAVVTINRPQARNAIDAGAARTLATLLAEIERDPAVHAAILTGAADICFGGSGGLDATLTLSRSGRLARRRWSRPGLVTPW